MNEVIKKLVVQLGVTIKQEDIENIKKFNTSLRALTKTMREIKAIASRGALQITTNAQVEGVKKLTDAEKQAAKEKARLEKEALANAKQAAREALSVAKKAAQEKLAAEKAAAREKLYDLKQGLRAIAEGIRQQHREKTQEERKALANAKQAAREALSAAKKAAQEQLSIDKALAREKLHNLKQGLRSIAEGIRQQHREKAQKDRDAAQKDRKDAADKRAMERKNNALLRSSLRQINQTIREQRAEQRRLSQEWDRSTTRLKENLSGVLKTLTMVKVAAAAVGFGAFRVTAARADEALFAQRQAGSLGVSTQEFQRLQKSFERFGTDRTDFMDMMMQLAEKVAKLQRGDKEAKSLFARMGLSKKDFEGKDASGAVDVVARAAIANKGKFAKGLEPFSELLGEDLQKKVLAALQLGPEQLSAIKKDVEKSGIILSDKDMKTLNAFSYQWQRVKEFVQGAATTFAKNFAPSATRMMETFVKFLAEEETIREIGEAGEKLGHAFETIGFVLDRILKAGELIFGDRASFISFVTQFGIFAASSVIVGKTLSTISSSLWAAKAAAAALGISLAPFAAYAALAAASLGVIFIIAEDIYGYFNGYDSAIGRMIEKWKSGTGPMRDIALIIENLPNYIQNALIFLNLMWDIFERFGPSVESLGKALGMAFGGPLGILKETLAYILELLEKIGVIAPGRANQFRDFSPGKLVGDFAYQSVFGASQGRDKASFAMDPSIALGGSNKIRGWLGMQPAIASNATSVSSNDTYNVTINTAAKDGKETMRAFEEYMAKANRDILSKTTPRRN